MAVFGIFGTETANVASSVYYGLYALQHRGQASCGIVVNDSILKIDSINELRKAGTPLMQAIHTAGIRRLRPIVMTSLTTIVAMAPLLFSNDMGSELQRPLAIAMTGSMLLGTLVSLFIIPLIYWFIYRRKESLI